ncbi:PorT family protein [Myroides odoratimimus]|uniref:porin family protein n=1 Tax=Myroides odoratimimus TaxID=76832 RepID=UPI00257563BF|nr:porin family protein [Myroides odoratimimus]MDM1097599.1 PorT family protein [Myroides odoratimimus]MDM1443962.1 PorT family protein [Myroides odoratimimus]
MRKITLSLIAALAIGFSANAQTPDVKIGAKGGLSISNISNLDESSSRPAFHIGAVAEIFINEKFSIQPELLYSAQGARYDYTETIEGYNFYSSKTKTETLKLDYITIPVIAKYYIVKGLNVQAGPQFAFNVTAKNHMEDIKENVKSFEFGLGLGAGYELSNGIFFDTRYNVGLSKVNKEGDASRNGVLQLSVGYKF